MLFVKAAVAYKTFCIFLLFDEFIDGHTGVAQIVRADVDKKSIWLQVQNTGVKVVDQLLRHESADPPVIYRDVQLILGKLRAADEVNAPEMTGKRRN